MGAEASRFTKLYPYKYWYHHWEILPVVASTQVAILFVVGHLTASCYKKEFRFNRNKPEFHEAMSLLHPYNPKYIKLYEPRPMPELHNTYQKMKKAEKRLRKKYPNMKPD